jgi:DnaJ-class molecular chaperone
VYRDPRWHSIVACADCGGTGLAGAHECPVCDGRGTLRLAPVDAPVYAGDDAPVRTISVAAETAVDAGGDAAVVR